MQTTSMMFLHSHACTSVAEKVGCSLATLVCTLSRTSFFEIQQGLSLSNVQGLQSESLGCPVASPSPWSFQSVLSPL
jgi:hypothetical protein